MFPSKLFGFHVLSNQLVLSSRKGYLPIPNCFAFSRNISGKRTFSLSYMELQLLEMVTLRCSTCVFLVLVKSNYSAVFIRAAHQQNSTQLNVVQVL